MPSGTVTSEGDVSLTDVPFDSDPECRTCMLCVDAARKCALDVTGRRRTGGNDDEAVSSGGLRRRPMMSVGATDESGGEEGRDEREEVEGGLGDNGDGSRNMKSGSLVNLKWGREDDVRGIVSLVESIVESTLALGRGTLEEGASSVGLISKGVMSRDEATRSSRRPTAYSGSATSPTSAMSVSRARGSKLPSLCMLMMPSESCMRGESGSLSCKAFVVEEPGGSSSTKVASVESEFLRE